MQTMYHSIEASRDMQCFLEQAIDWTLYDNDGDY